jgi:hypothetical protein
MDPGHKARDDIGSMRRQLQKLGDLGSRPFNLDMLWLLSNVTGRPPVTYLIDLAPAQFLAADRTLSAALR